MSPIDRSNSPFEHIQRFTILKDKDFVRKKVEFAVANWEVQNYLAGTFYDKKRLIYEIKRSIAFGLDN